MADSRFLKFFNYILLVEGSYSNDKNDKGGETKYGITKERARECGYKGNMKDLTKATAQKIYEEKYYKARKLDQVKNDKVALSIFDFSVNAGRYGIKKAQEAVNKVYGKNVVSVDGAIGPQTLKYSSRCFFYQKTLYLFSSFISSHKFVIKPTFKMLILSISL